MICGSNNVQKIMKITKVVIVGNNNNDIYTKERCHNLCTTYCLDPVHCDECGGFQVGVQGTANEGKCAIYKAGCAKDATDPAWEYYDLNECSYSGRVLKSAIQNCIRYNFIRNRIRLKAFAYIFDK